MSTLADRMWSDVAELNALARHALVSHPAPAGLPEPGTWARVYSTDDDMFREWHGLWHLVVGWNYERGRLALRCSNRNRTFHGAVVLSTGWGIATTATMPESEACSRCVRLLGLDRARQAQAA